MVKKASLLLALALAVASSIAPLTPPVAAQYDSSTLAQMGAMGTVNAHIAERGERAKRDAARTKRRTRKSRVSPRRTRTRTNYRTIQRTTPRSRR